ncbi:hypothetical protein M9H77_03312 [Catharanthus roseus]|uniref:Uncharacterized protein n=1 Tax=Catharanthus roseus TaxID=4058 RepID=A0ACC0CAV3_CATRO|nr:hypothetical protein M9H77_03312 [Catharanthus roseus]
MPRKKRGKLVVFDPELELSLWSAYCALRLETANNNTIIAVEKMEEGQEYIILADARMQSMEAIQWNQEASIHNLENRIRQLAKMISEKTLGALPSNTEKNPREHAKAVTLRSGKELVDMPPILVDKEKENVTSPFFFESG